MSDFKITNYRIILGNGTHTTDDATRVEFGGYIEIGGVHPNGSSKFVTFFFLSKNSPVPHKAGFRVGEADWLYIPIEQMPLYIDVLRNEKPIGIKVNVDDAAYTKIRTAVEPPGEGE